MIHSLLEFSERAALEAKKPFIDHPYLGTICEALEDFATGNLPNGATNLCITIAPRHYKTTIASINFPAWCWGEISPDCEFIGTSATAGLAVDLIAVKLRKLVSESWYQETYPHVTIDKTEKDVQHSFKTTNDGAFYAAGLKGTITGYGAGKSREGFAGSLNIDDPLKASDRRSPKMLESCVEYYTGTLQNRRNKGDQTPTLVVMQRLSERDLVAWIEKNENPDEWYFLRMPAHDENDNVLNPTTTSMKYLKAIKKYDPDTYWSQYMQDPKTGSQRMFKYEYWQYYTEVPVLKRKIIYGDTAQKDKERNDYTVFQCWGQGMLDNRMYLLAQYRGKPVGPDLRKAAVDFWNANKNTHGLRTSCFKVEDKSSGTDLIQSLSRSTIPVEGIPRSIDKYTRQIDGVPYIAAGNVVLPENWDGLQDYKDEFWEAPDGEHDDQIDPTLDAIDDMLGGVQINYDDLL